jgi:hypothetical protein
LKTLIPMEPVELQEPPMFERCPTSVVVSFEQRDRYQVKLTGSFDSDERCFGCRQKQLGGRPTHKGRPPIASHYPPSFPLNRGRRQLWSR